MGDSSQSTETEKTLMMEAIERVEAEFPGARNVFLDKLISDCKRETTEDRMRAKALHNTLASRAYVAKRDARRLLASLNHLVKAFSSEGIDAEAATNGDLVSIACRGFIAAWIRTDRGHELSASKIYGVFVEWWKKTVDPTRIPSQKKFGRHFGHHFDKRKAHTGRVVYSNVALTDQGQSYLYKCAEDI